MKVQVRNDKKEQRKNFKKVSLSMKDLKAFWKSYLEIKEELRDWLIFTDVSYGNLKENMYSKSTANLDRITKHELERCRSLMIFGLQQDHYESRKEKRKTRRKGKSWTCRMLLVL